MERSRCWLKLRLALRAATVEKRVRKCIAELKSIVLKIGDSVGWVMFDAVR